MDPASRRARVSTTELREKGSHLSVTLALLASPRNHGTNGLCTQPKAVFGLLVSPW